MNKYEQRETVLLEDWKLSLSFDDNGDLQTNVFIKKGSTVFVRKVYNTFLVMNNSAYHPINGHTLQISDRESLDKFVKTEKNWFK